jgi:hypothetical protein
MRSTRLFFMLTLFPLLNACQTHKISMSGKRDPAADISISTQYEQIILNSADLLKYRSGDSYKDSIAKVNLTQLLLRNKGKQINIKLKNGEYIASEDTLGYDWFDPMLFSVLIEGKAATIKWERNDAPKYITFKIKITYGHCKNSKYKTSKSISIVDNSEEVIARKRIWSKMIDCF